MPEPRLSGILETAIYCATAERDEVERVYRETLRLPEVARWRDGTAFRVGPGVLLVFDSERLTERDQPMASHGCAGPSHVCLLAAEGEYDTWKERLAEAGLPALFEEEWSEGRRSFYFRDPAGNLLEIAEADIWPPE